MGYLGLSIGLTNLRAAGVRAAVGNDFQAFFRKVLLNAAKADGDVAEEELQTITIILKHALELDVTRQELLEELAGETFKSGQLVAYLKMSQRALNPDQRSLLFKALIHLFSADGRWTGNEKKLLQRYLVALGESDKAAKELVGSISHKTAPANP